VPARGADQYQFEVARAREHNQQHEQ
jgi:hypothetical protein